jgi:vacuolar-type H+-ATPase subunit F/Vma7
VHLTCKPFQKKTDDKPPPSANVTVDGYIYDADDSSLVAETRVYLRQNRQSAITNDYGYFSISFPKTSDVLSISVAKENYEDTTIVILSKQRTTIVIYLQPKAPATKITIDDSLVVKYEPVVDTLPQAADSLPEEPFSFWSRFKKTHSNLRNITDTLFTQVSVSLVPPLSTNRLLAVNTVNKVSFNILAGYSRGIDGFELGGLVNLDYGDVRYIQAAGLTNLVSGSSTGLQVAGLLNTVGKDVSGLQVAGIVNLDRGNVRHVQVAGIGNGVFGSVTGVQVGGIFNVAGDSVSGFQLAGISNFTPRMKGMQLAGVSNSVWRIDGTQLAGIANTADTVYGFQLAGIANTADYIKGFQLSGIVNRAGHIDGSQIGLINVARSTTGVPFGLLSYVRDGYHKVEFATDENLLSTISLRTGVNALHNIFLAGAQFTGEDRAWTVGYGLGTAIPLSRRFYLSFDVTGQQVQVMGTGNIDYNLLSKAYLGLEFRIAKKFSISAGPTLNWLNADSEGTDYDLVQQSLHQPALYEESNGQFTNRLWAGGRVSIKFF